MESINESIAFYNTIEKYKTSLGKGSGKLCISPFTLSQINEALDSLVNNESSSPVEIAYSERIVLYDLENILKSTYKLKLIQRNVATYSGLCDLSRYLSLKQAEFHKISLDNVISVETDSSAIECISCFRCINVYDLFTNCVWTNLKFLTLSYCQLSKIDAECFSNIKSVEHLNLSFNNLTSIKGLELLNNLGSLDISFNYLDEIPIFKEESNSCLTELLLNNNNISSLTGLKELVNLVYLDLSNNCIYEKEFLIDLYSLKRLKCLRLNHNPLCFRKHYRMYVSHFLGTFEPPFQFILDDVALSGAELDFIGSSKGIVPRTPRPSQINSPLSPVAINDFEVVQDLKGILKSSNRKSRKGREVVIVESTGDPTNTTIQKSRKTGVVIRENLSLDNGTVEINQSGSDLNKQASISENNSLNPFIPSEYQQVETKNEKKETEVLPPMLKENVLNEQIFKEAFLSGMHSSPESTQTECQTVEVTVHATESDYTPESNDEIQPQMNESKTVDINDIRILESIDLILQNEKTENDNNFLSTADNIVDTSIENKPIEATVCENMTDDNINNNEEILNSKYQQNKVPEDKSSSDDSASEDELTGDENLWPVQKIVDSKPVNMFLVLLETELRERSTISGRTIATYPLAFVQSCIQVNEDPLTIELIFSSLLKNKIVRTYIMEFADAQTLISKINVFLASRPDEVENQLTSFLCKSCNAFFSVYKTPARTLCTVCGSTLVDEMEKPSIEAVEDPLSSSSSQSSIVSSSHGASESKPSSNNITNMYSVSTVSSEPSEKSEIVNSLYTSLHQKYESDIEIISNPSQSSIEVIDDRSTPSRKRSSEERNVMIAPVLATLEEVSDSQLPSISESSKCPPMSDVDAANSIPLGQEMQESSDSKSVHDFAVPSVDLPNNPLLTESSSSGSAVTTYEANGSVSNQPSITAQEIHETSFDASEIDAYESCIEEIDSSISVSEVESDTANKEAVTKLSDIYSYTNFTEVDHRIKAFLYQSVFSDDSEQLSLLVRCHLWKTGGNDYPACFVLSNKRIYIFMHTPITNGLDASDWLQLQESLDLKCIKKVFPLAWNLGIGTQINRLNYFIILNNKTYSENLHQAFKSLSLKGCDVGSKSSSKVELNLQQVVLTSNYVRDVIDPTIILYTVCLSINILKDDEMQETMKLGGFVMTANEFYIVLGDFSWLAGNSEVPSIHFFQLLTNLIEIRQNDETVTLHFLDETEAVEVVWCLQCLNSGQIDLIIEAMRGPWEKVFSEPLQVTIK